MQIIGEVDGRAAVIVDDMVDTAGTLCAAAEAVRAAGAPLVLACATHAVLSGPADRAARASPRIDELIVTDTIPLRADGARAREDHASSRSPRCSARRSGARTTRPRSARSSSEGITHGNRRDHHRAPQRTPARARRAGSAAPGSVPGGPLRPEARRRRTSASSAEEFERKLAHLEGSHLIRLVHADGADAELHERMVLVREMQRHPVTGRVLHADFYEVDLTERLVVSVPLHFVGKAAGVVAGGILQPILREIEVECLPTEIPEFIEVDVTRARHPRRHPPRRPEAARGRARRSASRPRRSSPCCRRRSRRSRPRRAEARRRGRGRPRARRRRTPAPRRARRRAEG